MEKIGLFGGTFDPPHSGHIQAAEYALKALNLDKVLLIPCSAHPGKSEQMHYAGAKDRLEMTRLALLGHPGLEASDWEIARGGQTYTADTIEQAKKIHSGAKIYLLMGSDQFLSVDQWKDWETISGEVTFAVFGRGIANEAAAVNAQMEKLKRSGAEAVWLDNPVNMISSTQLRRLIAFHAPEAFLNESVLSYIRSKGLYDSCADWKTLPMDELERVVIRLLKPNRVKHVLGVRDTAVLMARRWGVNEDDAARAGILHDITKALDGPLQLTLCDGYGKILSDFSRKYPKTLHAYTGSLVAKEIFGENDAVVDAICCHTTGKADMNDLEKIIYVADYMEPNRAFPGVEELRRLAYTDLTQALRVGLEMTLEYLHHQGSEVSPESREALDYLNR